MPAYAKEGNVICFFKAASKYKERYATFGFDMAADFMGAHEWCMYGPKPGAALRFFGPRR